MALFGTVASAVSQARSLAQDVRSRFQQVSTPLAALEAGPPSAALPELSFPKSELLEIDHWVDFKAFETKQLDRSTKGVEEPLAVIRLPMPGNLETQYRVSYADFEPGAFGKMILDAMSPGGGAVAAELAIVGGMAGIGAVAGALAGGDAAAGAAIGAIGGGVLTSSSGGQSGNAALSQVVQGTNFIGAVAGQQGLASNPHKVVLFQGIGFRSHSFSYSLIAKNYAEAEIIRSIIKSFKRFASPGYGSTLKTGLADVAGIIPYEKLKEFLASGQEVNISAGRHFFKYPEFFTITFHHDDFLFKIGPSVITDFSVNYHPLNQPTYARADGKSPTPIQINIGIQFQETEIVTKESIDGDNR